MEDILCDDILGEIFTRLPSSSIESVPLVSKRWLRLYRASKTFMSLGFDPRDSSVIPLLPSIFNNYPSLSSLSLIYFVYDNSISYPETSFDEKLKAELVFNDKLISIISSRCFNLRNLSILVHPMTLSSLLPLATSFSLTSLSLILYRPKNSDFTWVTWFPFLKELSVMICKGKPSGPSGFNPYHNSDSKVVELGLESISLTYLDSVDTGVNWLWKSCRKLKKLYLKHCETIGEIEFFGLCLKNLEEIELRTCRKIVDVVLLKATEVCESLKSLLIHDGGKRDVLAHFMNNSRCNDTLTRVDLELGMGLIDDHLSSLASNFKSISSLRLMHNSFVTGFGIRALALSFSSNLEELSLPLCGAIMRERSLWAILGQSFGRLRKLELHLNHCISEEDVVSMLASCNGLMEVNLRGCVNLTGSVLVALNKNCVKLKHLNIVSCELIQPHDVEAFVMNSSHWFKKLVVEENQITEATIKLASTKLIETVVHHSFSI